MNSVIDKEYYAEVQAGSIAETMLIKARDAIYRDFLARMRPQATDRILDVGTSDVINDGANVLERCYPYQSQITACGIGEGVEFKRAFPETTYVKIEPNVRLPFADNAFEIATSNAVLEHVGSFENQKYFVSELCRVAQRVFISVPNRFFPIEHHTSVPFAHWTDSTFKLATQLVGKEQWTSEETLILMSRKLLWRLAAPVRRKSAAVGYTGLALGPFSSNLYLAFH